MRGHDGVDRHWWPRIRAPSAHNGLRIRRRFAFDYTPGFRGVNVTSRNVFNSNTNVLSTRHNYDKGTIFEYTAMT